MNRKPNKKPHCACGKFAMGGSDLCWSCRESEKAREEIQKLRKQVEELKHPIDFQIPEQSWYGTVDLLQLLQNSGIKFTWRKR